jgi:hypothetical protein
MEDPVFLLYLHQNYGLFTQSTEELAEASAYLSEADIFCGSWNPHYKLSNYAISVASRGLLISWNSSCPRESQFSAFVKPELFQVEKHAQLLKRNVFLDLFSLF